MDLSLGNRAVLVVGATGGMGRAICRTLVAEGLGRLALGVRDTDAGRQLGEELMEHTSTRVEVVACDLSSPDQPAACVTEVERLNGHLDALVWCAGDPPWGGLWDVTDDDWDRLLATMLMGPIRAARAAAPGMVARGWGRIVLIGGLNGRKPAAGGVIAGVVCAGLANFATALAKDVAASGVTVNVVEPHLTDTPRWQRQLELVQQRTGKSREDVAAELLKEVPRKHPVPPEDVASAVAYLLSDQAASINGTALAVDGATAPGIY